MEEFARIKRFGGVWLRHNALKRISLHQHFQRSRLMRAN